MKIKGILIDANNKEVNEVLITNPVEDLELFIKERNNFLNAKFNSNVNNLYDDVGEIFGRKYENAFYNGTYYFGNGFKIINNDLFIDRLIVTNRVIFYGKMLIIGEVEFIKKWENKRDSFIKEMSLSIISIKSSPQTSIENIKKSIEWTYTDFYEKKKIRKSTWEKQAEIDDYLSNQPF